MKTFKWVVEFEIDPEWVADGFELTDEVANEMITNQLSHATYEEVKGRVIKAPSAASIKKAQGYAK